MSEHAPGRGGKKGTGKGRGKSKSKAPPAPITPPRAKGGGRSKRASGSTAAEIAYGHPAPRAASGSDDP
eukprot:3296312-Alexandrium_andersonii.AAC.1